MDFPRDVTIETLNVHGFRKVNHSGGTLVTGDFYNPETGDLFHAVIRDYDYFDKSRDNDSLYDAPIDQETRKIWLHSLGVILEGDQVEVVKGRTLPHGSRWTVRKKYDLKDRYGRWIATYVSFGNGNKINIDNVVLCQEG